MADQSAEPTRLVLVRHAKAGESSGGGDRARALTEKGRADALRVGAWLASRVPRVDAVWSSSAVRARETTEGLLAGLADPPEAEWRDDLYDAGVDDLLTLLRAAPDEIRALVVVGHNPTIEAAHGVLTGDSRGFRPSAASVVELTGPWSEAAQGTGRAVDFFTP